MTLQVARELYIKQVCNCTPQNKFLVTVLIAQVITYNRNISSVNMPYY